MRVGQRLWWARRPICQTSVGLSTMKGSIVSRQIDRSVYYNVLPRDASRAPTNAGGTIPSGTPCKFLWSSRAQRVREEGGTLEGHRAPNSIFFAFSSRAAFPPPLLPPSRAIRDPDLHPPKFFSPSEKWASTPDFFPRPSLRPLLFPLARRMSALSLVVPPPFPSGEDRWYLPSSANFYFPASGVLKITLRPCLWPPHPRRIAVVVDRTRWGYVVTGEGLIPPTGIYSSKKSAEGERVSVQGRKMRTNEKRR